MSTQSKAFFPFTRAFSERVGRVTSFVWASYSGLWSIYQQANTLAKLSDSPKWREIEKYLVGAAPDSGGIDLKELSQKPWHEHQASYAEFILTQGALLYEEWCSQLAQLVAAPNAKLRSESFQFPSTSSSKNYANWKALLSSGAIAESQFLKAHVQPSLLVKFDSNIQQLDPLLRWYRYFKELRNCVVHNGSKADKKTVDAFGTASATALKGTLQNPGVGMTRDYAGSTPILGHKISINLTDTVLMLGVIQRLAYAFDALFCHSTAAESDLIARLQHALTSISPPKEAKAGRKTSWIRLFMAHKGGIAVSSNQAIEQWLKAKGLVAIRTI